MCKWGTLCPITLEDDKDGWLERSSEISSKCQWLEVLVQDGNAITQNHATDIV